MLSSIASRSFCTSLPEDIMAASTDLCLKPMTWSTIREMRGETTITSLDCQAYHQTGKVVLHNRATVQVLDTLPLFGLQNNTRLIDLFKCIRNGMIHIVLLSCQHFC